MDAAEQLAFEIADKQGRRPHRVAREWRVLCPVHEADGSHHKPSLAIWPTGEKTYAVKCMTGCPSSDVWRGLRALGVKASQRGGSTALDRLKSAQARETRRVEQLNKIREILATAGDFDDQDDPVEAYLDRRQLLPLPKSELHTILRSDDVVMKGPSAFCGVICDMTTLKDERPECVGLTLLSLDRNAEPVLANESGKKLRSIYGQSKGYAVPFGIPGPKLVVAEGVESMLAAMKLLEIPFGAATLAAPNMPHVAIPEYVREVVIAADNDKPGMEAAAALMNDLGHVGLNCSIKRWGRPDSGWDAADEIKEWIHA